MNDPVHAMIQPIVTACIAVVDYVGDRFNDCVMALGSFLDRLTDGVRGLGKSALIDVEGVGSRLNPMNWARQYSPSPSITPPEAPATPKLGRSAAYAMEVPVTEKATIAPLQASMSKYQGAFDQFKGVMGGNIGLDLNLGEAITGLVPNCAHFSMPIRSGALAA